MSLVYGFTRIVRREGIIQTKKTLLNIPYISCHHYPSRHNQGCPQTDQTYSNFKSYLRTSLSESYICSITSSGELLDVWPYEIDTSKGWSKQENPRRYTWSRIYLLSGGTWKNWSEMGKIPATGWMRLSRIGAPTRSTIWYLQRGSKPYNGIVLPSTELSPEWKHIPSSKYGRNSVERNYRKFIHPWAQMRGARRLVC